MASWGKERNKPPLRMPVRLGMTRHTMGHLYNGGTLHTTLPAPRNVVKTPQGLKLVPAKRNILGQCLAYSPSCLVGLSSQAKEPIPRERPKPGYNTRVQALRVADANQNLLEASNVRPLTSSPLVSLEEYEKHHKGRVNIGIFKDFETFRTLPEPHTVQVPFLPSKTRLAEGVPTSKRKSISASKYKKKYASKPVAVKKVSQILRQPSRLGKTLIPISVPKSPHIKYNTQNDVLKTSTLGRTPATNMKKHDHLFSKSSVLDIPSVYKTNTNISSLTYKHKPALQPTDSQLDKQNKTLTGSIEQLCGNDENKLPHLGGFMKHDQQCNVSLTNNAQTCNSFEPKLLEDCKPTESHTTHNSCDLHGIYSCLYPVIGMEQKFISLVQEQCDLQNQKTDLQKQLADVYQKESNCLKKMLELREENIKLLHAQNAKLSQVKPNIVDVIPLTPTQDVITKTPVSIGRRRSARLAFQSKSKEEESQFIASANTSVIDIHTQLSLTKDTDSTKEDLQNTKNSSTKKRDTRRKSVVNYYGGLRRSFKHLLQTPTQTPGLDKSAKKVQFTVQDTPTQLSSNVMQQLNSLYDS